MKKKIAICAMIWLCSHSALIKQVNIAPDIQKYLTKHPDICAIYYVATPDKMLAKGISGCHNDKSKRIRPDAYQIQTTAITETMTAASIMLLHEQRKLNIHDHILKYIPVNYWPNGRLPYWTSKVTIHHLLRHTSGIASYRFQDQYKMDIHPKTDEITIKRKVLEYAVRNPIFYGVDQEYYHSSTDYFILGIIIENVSNQTLSNFFRENLFIPLGMNDTFLPSFIKRSNHPTKKEKKIESQVCLAFGDGGVITSVGDIHRWNVALHNMKIINEASYAQMTKTHWWLDTCCDPSGSVLDMFQKLGFKDCKDVAYGYGLHIIPLHSKAQVYCSSPGSCSGEEMWFLPDKNISIILLVNRDIPKLEKETLLETALLRNEIFSLVYK